MTKRERWIKGLIEETRTLTVPLPFNRGLRRQAMIARRMGESTSNVRLLRA